jgi:iron complex transport system ATP-binding protein
MIKANNLNFSYSSKATLKDVSFEVKGKSLCGVFGPNGSGKTTLIKCLAGLLRPSSGEILIDGSDIGSLKENEVARLVAYVPQDHKPFFPYLVNEIILMGRTPYLGGLGFLPGKNDLFEVARAIELLDLGKLADRPYTELSGGERQLVLLARGLAQTPKILFLDEPTLNLDFKNELKIWEILQSLKSRGNLTIVAATHNPNHILWYCDEAMILDGGRLILNGKTGDVMNEENINKLYGDKFRLSRETEKGYFLPRDK